MVYAKTDDSSVYYEIYGDGKPLVLIPGIACSIDFNWKEILPDLTRNFQVIAFDSRGIGKTQYGNKSFQIDEVANDIFFLLDHLGIDKVSLFGHSMGTAIALSFAHKYPNRVENLILSNGFARLNQRNRTTLEGAFLLLEEQVPVKKLLYLLMPWVFSEQFLSNPQNKNKVIELNATRNPTPEGVKHQIGALLSLDSRPWLKEINSRTLVISADDDLMFPFDEGRYLASQIENATFVQIPGGHASHVEQPLLVVSLINDFIQN